MMNHNNGPRFEPNPEVDQDAERIKVRMKTAPLGELVTYDEIGKLVGRAITSQDQSLRKALKAMWDEGVTFDCEPKIGYRRRDNEAEFDRADWNRRGIHRRFKKARTESGLVKRTELDPSQRPLHDARQYLFESGASETHGNSIRAKAKKSSASSPDGLLDANKRLIQNEIEKTKESE